MYISCKYVYVYRCVHMYAYMCMYVSVCRCIQCMFVCMHMDVDNCVYVSMCLYIQYYSYSIELSIVGYFNHIQCTTRVVLCSPKDDQSQCTMLYMEPISVLLKVCMFLISIICRSLIDSKIFEKICFILMQNYIIIFARVQVM